MQTPKARNSSSEVLQRTSPGTPRAAHELKILGSECGSTSTNPVSRTRKDRSPKITERRSPRSPVSEKKRPSRATELEAQIAQLEEDLKKTKDQFTTTEVWRSLAQQEAEETKKQLLAISMKLEESQQQLLEVSGSEEVQVQELHVVPQGRDVAWQSKLKAVRNQLSVDSAALSSAMKEIHGLKIHLELVAESEAAQKKQAEAAQSEIQRLKIDLAETLSVVENMKLQLEDSKESEAQAQARVSETLLQLETAKTTVEMLQSDAFKAKEAYNNLVLELDESRAHVNLLEGLVIKLQAELVKASNSHAGGSSGDGKSAGETRNFADSNELGLELEFMNLEMGELKAALEAVETRYQEEQIQCRMQIHSAYEMVGQTKAEACVRVDELEAELKKTVAHMKELKGNLMDKETKLQSISEENEELNLKLKQKKSSQREGELEVELQKLKADVSDLKANMMDKEIELQSILEENELLKLEMERSKVNDEAIAEAEAARAGEQEALMKVGCITEEADKSSRRVARVIEQLEAAQAVNSEMEAELRRLKVQSDQWRKAAEAAATFFSTGSNGKFMDRYVAGKTGLPNPEYMDDDLPKRKNNMLKKIGVLWKKGQK